jgi:hypothetical protein
MTSSNLHRLIRAREISPGVLPATPEWLIAYLTDETLVPTDAFVSSQTITGNRAIQSLDRTSVGVSGDISGELRYGYQGDWRFEMGLHKRFTGVEARGAQITGITASNQTIAVASGIVFPAGCLVKISYSSVEANNNVYTAQTGSGDGVIVVASGLVDAPAQSGNAVVRLVGLEAPAGDLSCDATGIVSASSIFENYDIPIGSLIKIGRKALNAGGRFATAANNIVAVVTGKTDAKLTLGNRGAGWAVDDGATKTIRIYFDGQIINYGTSPITEQYERVYSGQETPVYRRFFGCGADQFSIDLTRREYIASTLSLVGFSDSHSLSSQSSTPPAEPVEKSLITSSDLGRILINGAEAAKPGFEKSFTLQLANNLQPDGALNDAADCVYDLGDATLTGNIAFRFADATQLDRFRNQAPMQFLVPIANVRDDVGYAIYLPNALYTSENSAPGGRNAVVDIECGYQAVQDQAGHAITIARFDHVEW